MIPIGFHPEIPLPASKTKNSPLPLHPLLLGNGVNMDLVKNEKVTG